MILEIDMGNTRLKWRIRLGEGILAQGFIGTEAPYELLESELLPYRGAITEIWVASVVGEILAQKLAVWSLGFLNLPPRFARSSAVCGVVVNGYADPQLLGVDRWLSLVAAYHCLNKSCVVASFGTAVTVDVVASNGLHMGGYIAPGLNLMRNSLASGARQINPGNDAPKFDLSPADATTPAIYSAYTAMMVGLVNNAIQQLGGSAHNQTAGLVFTGGDADKIKPFFPQAQMMPGLVLDGLAYVMANQ